MSQVIYKTPATVPGGGPSPIIWADCPVVSMQKDPGKGIHIMEDFLGRYTNLSAADGLIAGFELVSAGGADGYATMDTTAYDNEHGVIQIEPCGNTQFDESYLVSQVLYQLAMNSERKMWFEARIKLETHDADMSYICGLGDATVLVGDAVIEEAAEPDHLLSRDFVGFVAFTDGSATEDIDAVYCEVGDAATTQVKDAAMAQASLADDTYIKLGLKFDGKKSLKYFIDGAEVGELDIDDFATVTANELTPLGIIIGSMCGADMGSAGDAPYIAIDWIRFACDRNDAQ